MAQHIYDGRGVLFWMTQIATFAILILAANKAAHLLGEQGVYSKS